MNLNNDMNVITVNDMWKELNSEHQQYINKYAFKDISKVLLDFHNLDDPTCTTKQVCTASMGHGKSSAIIAYLKSNTQQPILLSVREKQLAHEIYSSVSKVNKSIINLSSDNKEIYENDLYKYQIVIIQHERLKNLTLGFGNLFNYQYHSINKERVKRKLIIDEKPILHDSVTYDISGANNVLEWFDALTMPMKSKPLTVQKYKSLIMFLVSSQLADNNTDITTALNKNDVIKKTKLKELTSFLNEIQIHKDNANKYEQLNALKHFKKLMTDTGYGRIDDYTFNAIGRKIIVSKYIDYSLLKMNILVFDGTALISKLQYIHYQLIPVHNYNNYDRLYLYNDNINTSLYARTKSGHTTQKAIAKRIQALQHIHEDVFVLTMKDDVKVYHNENAISDVMLSYYKDNTAQQTKGINLLNTTGKNVLKDVTTLYMTCLPKRNAEHYKEIAISIYDNDVSLLTSDNDDGKWFQDERLQHVYECELYAELLQIIHRTKLRYIDSDDKISIYVAYNETKNIGLLDDLNRLYFNNNAHVPPVCNVVDMSMYGRNDTLDKFIAILDDMNICQPIPISKVSQSFKKFIQNHYSNKKNSIDDYLYRFGYEIIEKSDRYSEKSKYINKI